MVLIPEVLEAIAAIGSKIPVLAAGGIVTGRQMAASGALGADGAWTGSVWLTTEEAETAPDTGQKFLAATSRDTIRSAGRTGKPAPEPVPGCAGGSPVTSRRRRSRRSLWPPSR